MSKGSLEYISVMMAFALTTLLIILIAPYLSKTSFNTDLQAEQITTSKSFAAHSTLGAIRSNDELMENIRIATVDEWSDSTDSDNIFEEIGLISGDRTKTKLTNILNGQSNSHKFEIKEIDDEGPEVKAKIERRTLIERRYSEVLIASPSKNKHEMSLGLGGLD